MNSKKMKLARAAVPAFVAFMLLATVVSFTFAAPIYGGMIFVGLIIPGVALTWVSVLWWKAFS